MTVIPPGTPTEPGPPVAIPSVYPTARPNDNMAIVSLVIALVSLFGGVTFLGVPGVIGGVVAVVLGLRARGRIKRSGGALAGGGIALAGWIIGIAAIVLGVIWSTFLIVGYIGMSSGKGGT